MILIANLLSPEEIQTLEDMHENHQCHAPRVRTHAILLSHSGVNLSMIARICYLITRIKQVENS